MSDTVKGPLARLCLDGSCGGIAPLNGLSHVDGPWGEGGLGEGLMLGVVHLTQINFNLSTKIDLSPGNRMMINGQ